MFDFPPTTLVNRVIPKTRIVENCPTRAPGSRTSSPSRSSRSAGMPNSPRKRSKFPATPQVPEIQVFHLALKGDRNPSRPPLPSSTRPSPSPCSSAIETAEHISWPTAPPTSAPARLMSAQWVVGARFTSGFTSKDSPRPPVPCFPQPSTFRPASTAPSSTPSSRLTAREA